MVNFRHYASKYICIAILTTFLLEKRRKKKKKKTNCRKALTHTKKFSDIFQFFNILHYMKNRVCRSSIFEECVCDI